MYAITGATGNTGRVAAERLLAAGKKVRAIGRSAEKLHALATHGAETAVADLGDVGALTRAFRGVQAVYAIIPPNIQSPDFRAEQNRISAALARAIPDAGVEFVVTLSSLGAELPQGTGPIAGLHELEQALNAVPGLNTLHLRAAYFMENTLAQIGAIRAMGMAVGPLRGDLKLPMIATADIGEAAAHALIGLHFGRGETRELLGPKDVSMNEAVSILGRVLQLPDLAYRQLSNDELRAALQKLGWSANAADLLIEMADGLNRGYIHPLEKRTSRNTTPTSYETFVEEVFIPSYLGDHALAGSPR